MADVSCVAQLLETLVERLKDPATDDAVSPDRRAVQERPRQARRDGQRWVHARLLALLRAGLVLLVSARSALTDCLRPRCLTSLPAPARWCTVLALAYVCSCAVLYVAAAAQRG
jgi:hypothetical protein